MEKNYLECNALPVLNKLEALIDRGYSRHMRDVYNDLSIFDWWTERLSVAQMKQMRTFLKAAIKLGYTGYVCFKVGASGCANGMWAHKTPTTDGYSPDSDAIYRSFTPDYTYYAASKNDKWYPGEETDGHAYNSCKTVKQLEALVASL